MIHTRCINRDQMSELTQPYWVSIIRVGSVVIVVTFFRDTVSNIFKYWFLFVEMELLCDWLNVKRQGHVMVCDILVKKSRKMEDTNAGGGIRVSYT